MRAREISGKLSVAHTFHRNLIFDERINSLILKGKKHLLIPINKHQTRLKVHLRFWRLQLNMERHRTNQL